MTQVLKVCVGLSWPMEDMNGLKRAKEMIAHLPGITRSVGSKRVKHAK